jgi:hypothetical protein
VSGDEFPIGPLHNHDVNVAPLGNGADDVFTIDTDNLHNFTRYQIEGATASNERAGRGRGRGCVASVRGESVAHTRGTVLPHAFEYL